MNRIFFKGKGHTIKRGIPNVWPYKSISITPIDFFSEHGLTLRLDPKAMNRGQYFKCEFSAIINHTVTVVEYSPGRQYLNYEVAVHGSYNNWNNGFANIQLSKDLTGTLPDQRQDHANIQKAAVDLVYAGIEQFENYFMK
jgi:hypothetical protein